MRSPRPLVPPLAAVALLVTALLVGCGSKDPTTPEPSKSVSYADLAPEPTKRCGYPEGTRKVVVPSTDGMSLAGAEVGSGTRGVVLLHQRSADLCGWSVYVESLTKAGFHVLAIDFRCNGMSDCTRDPIGDNFDQSMDYAADAGSAVAFLRKAGATKVAVMGASMGAVTAVVTGGRFPDQVDAVVGLSVFSLTWNASGSGKTLITTPEKAIPKTTAPILIGVAGLDLSGSIDAATAHAVLKDAPAAARSKVVDRPEIGNHGWTLLDDGDDSVMPDVLAFLKANLGS